MDDKEQLEQLYYEMVNGWIEKDRAKLEQVWSPEFVLEHINGHRQTGKEYLDILMSGALNFYSQKTDCLKISVDGNSAAMVGQSRIVNGPASGEKREVRLQMDCMLERTNGSWVMTSAKASAY